MDKTELPFSEFKKETKIKKIETFIEHLAYIFGLITAIIMCVILVSGGLYMLIKYLLLN